MTTRQDPAVLSDIPQIRSMLESRLDAALKAGVTVRLKQTIPYGTQLWCDTPSGTGLFNIYYSAKKGFSFVDCSKNESSAEAIAALSGTPIKKSYGDPGGKREQELQSWIGTDESGKGDFFGPLVVAGVFVTRSQEEELRAMGVADSKTLNSRKIRDVAGHLRAALGNRICVVAPNNRTYNELYAKFGNLNKLLAWGHARVIENLIETVGGPSGRKVDGVVADQFGDENYIRNALESMRAINLIQRPRGESNVAVAAASVIARDWFEKKMEALRDKYNIEIPFGCGGGVVAAAKVFVTRFGKQALCDAAKTHFKVFNGL